MNDFGRKTNASKQNLRFQSKNIPESPYRLFQLVIALRRSTQIEIIFFWQSDIQIEAMFNKTINKTIAYWTEMKMNKTSDSFSLICEWTRGSIDRSNESIGNWIQSLRIMQNVLYVITSSMKYIQKRASINWLNTFFKEKYFCRQHRGK